MKIERFEDIECWKKGRELTDSIYKLTNTDRFSKDRGLRDQIRRAAVSVMSNIAEGFERSTDKEFKQFLYISKGSCAEVRSQLYISYDQGYITEKDFLQTIKLCEEISKMISKFITYLRKSA